MGSITKILGHSENTIDLTMCAEWTDGDQWLLDLRLISIQEDQEIRLVNCLRFLARMRMSKKL